jgi:hypothetical protein|tara:strand:+ start:259 stop:858 length:600 start_codon:yes stop_codon:yes gene_type:complete
VRVVGLSAKEIAVAIEDTSRCVCGQIAKSKYECESTDCNSEFCFQCMQKYIHGRIVIPHKLCEKHYISETKCLELDEKLSIWEGRLSSIISSIEVQKSLLKSKAVKPSLFLIGGILMIYWFIDYVNSDDYALLIGGAICFIMGFIIMPITRSSLESNEKLLENLIEDMPDNNPNERPKIPTRENFKITDKSVKDYLVFV